jgi:hypothetical protein
MTKQTTLDAAIAAGKAGHKVFPVIENGKIPAVGGWQHKATTDEAKIRAMWTDKDPVLGDRIKNYNIGVSTEGLLVLDVDNKNGKRGSDTLAELDLFHGVPKTFTVKTPTGGLHLYFAPESSVANSAGRLGLGLDVRGDGGYVVGPGSTIDGVPYEGDLYPMQPAPRWLEERAGRPSPRASSAKVVELLDTTGAVARATKFLEDAEPATEGQGGDAYTFKVAASVKDLGVSELTALELMAEVWNPRCSPPWDFEHLATKVANAYAYGKRPVGEKAPEADFEAAQTDDFPIQRTERPKLYVREFGDIKPRLADTYLVQKLLGEESMSVVYGESNTGKTFFAMAAAFSIASGGTFATRKVAKGAVIYVAAEAGVSAENRIAALRQHHKVDQAPFGLVPCPVDLLRPTGDVQALIDLVRDYEAKHGKVKLIVIDTLSRAIAGGNENSPDDMGALVKHLDAVRAATKAHVMIVHHSGKDAAKGARGHSLLRAATDTEIEIANGVARATKQRDMEMGEPIGFDLAVVQLGRSSEGEEVTSCVCVPIDEAGMDFGVDPDERRLILDALDAAVKANGGKPVALDRWTDVCINYISAATSVDGEGVKKGPFSGVTLENRRQTIKRMRDKMLREGTLRKNKREQWSRA